MWIHIDQSARRDFHTILGPQEIKIRGLADGHDHRVAFDLALAVLIENRLEAALLIEHRLRLQNFERRYSPIVADESLWAKSRMQDDAFGLGLFNFFQRCRHLRAVFEAN